jgi:hypothetical protein
MNGWIDLFFGLHGRSFGCGETCTLTLWRPCLPPSSHRSRTARLRKHTLSPSIPSLYNSKRPRNKGHSHPRLPLTPLHVLFNQPRAFRALLRRKRRGKLCDACSPHPRHRCSGISSLQVMDAAVRRPGSGTYQLNWILF